MGETTSQPFQLSFNAVLKVEFQGSRVTSDGGLILVRELDERLGLSDLIAQHITDPQGRPMERVGLAPLMGEVQVSKTQVSIDEVAVPLDSVTARFSKDGCLSATTGSRPIGTVSVVI